MRVIFLPKSGEDRKKVVFFLIFLMMLIFQMLAKTKLFFTSVYNLYKKTEVIFK